MATTKRAKTTKPSVARAKKPMSAAARARSMPLAPVDLASRDPEGRTPLHVAAFFGYASSVYRMLEQHADVNARDNGERTPGHWSAYKGYQDVVKLLIDSGADINARDADGRTWLRMAIIGQKTDMEAMLRAQGAVL